MRNYSLLQWLPLLAWTLLASGCDRFPNDPRNSLDEILKRGTLRVGATENSPWVIKGTSGEARGAEAMLVARFADELGVAIEWHWGSAEEHFEALSRYELDVAVGGFTKSNPWKKHVGFSVPYYTSDFIVGVPATEPVLADVQGVTVAIRPASGLRNKLEERGAKVTIREKLDGFVGPVAAEAWEIDELGLRRIGIRLQQHHHVIAAPPGENALLVRLESFLLQQNNGGVRELLGRASTP